MEQGNLSEEHSFLSEKRNTFFQHLEALFEEKSLLDVTLCCKGESIRAHRVVLACCSPYFAKILKATVTNEPTFIFNNTSKHEMMYVIDYMYKGNVKVPKNFMSSFEKLLKLFEVEGASHNGDNGPMEQTEVDITARLSFDVAVARLNPVLHERLKNSKIETPGTSKDNSRSNSSSVKLQDQHRVINPYACTSKSPKGHDRSSNSPKKKTDCTTTRRMSDDSDVEVIEKQGTVLVISDVQDSSSPEFCSKTRKPCKRQGELNSDDSDFAQPSSRKRIPVVDSSGEESEPAASTVKKRGWIEDRCKLRKDGEGPSKAVTDVVDVVASTAKKDGKATEVLNSDPKTFRKMRNFCVVCKVHKKNLLCHVKKYHKSTIRQKKFGCKVCFKKFAFEKFLEVHVCKK